MTDLGLVKILKTVTSRHEEQIKLIAQLLAIEHGYSRKFNSVATDCGGDFEGVCINANGEVLEVGDEPSPENCNTFWECKKVWKIYKLLNQLPASWFEGKETNHEPRKTP